MYTVSPILVVGGERVVAATVYIYTIQVVLYSIQYTVMFTILPPCSLPLACCA